MIAQHLNITFEVWRFFDLHLAIADCLIKVTWSGNFFLVTKVCRQNLIKNDVFFELNVDGPTNT